MDLISAPVIMDVVANCSPKGQERGQERGRTGEGDRRGGKNEKRKESLGRLIKLHRGR